MRQLYRSGIVSRSSGTPVVSDKTLLSASDFTYIGKFYTPGTEVGGEMHFSRGQMAMKRVGGTHRFWMIGNNDHQRIYTFDRVASEQTATIIDTYQPTWLEKCLIKDELDFVRISSIQWLGDQFWMAYTTGYEGTSHNPSYLYIEFNEANDTSTTYGPWGITNLHSGFSAGALHHVPEWFQTAYSVGSVLNVSRQTVQRGSSSHGVSCYALDLPSDPTTDAADTLDGPPYTIMCSKLAEGTISAPMARPWQPEVIFCRNTTYDPVADRMGAFWNGSTSQAAGSVSLDWVDSAVWVDNATKHGVVSVGQWLDKLAGETYPTDDMPHAWYGPGICVHGHDSYPTGYEATGPGTSELVSFMWITDPEELALGVTSAKPLHEVVPTHTFKLSEIQDYNLGDKRQNLYQFGGMCYDPVDRLLFISVRLRYTNPYNHYVPYIMVFQVAD